MSTDSSLQDDDDLWSEDEVIDLLAYLIEHPDLPCDVCGTCLAKHGVWPWLGPSLGHEFRFFD